MLAREATGAGVVCTTDAMYDQPSAWVLTPTVNHPGSIEPVPSALTGDDDDRRQRCRRGGMTMNGRAMTGEARRAGRRRWAGAIGRRAIGEAIGDRRRATMNRRSGQANGTTIGDDDDDGRRQATRR